MKNNDLVQNYSKVLDFIKSLSQYIIIFTMLSSIFGYIHISSYLFSIKNFWLIDFIEYKTILSWGLPFGTFVVINSIFVFSDHLDHQETPNFQKSIVTSSFIMIGIYIIFLATNLYFSDKFYPYPFYVIASLFISIWLLDITFIIDHFRYNNKITGNTIIFATTAPIFILISIVVCGTLRGYYITNYNDYSNFAFIKNKKYGVLLNNNHTVILSELNQSLKIKIIKLDQIDYFVKENEHNSSISNKLKDNKTLEKNL